MKSAISATFDYSSTRMVADRHRLAAYHNKHCWRAFRRYQHRWSWTTLNPRNSGFSEFFAILGYGVHWASEFSLKLLEIDKTTCVLNYTDAVARLMSISSDFFLTYRSSKFVLTFVPYLSTSFWMPDAKNQGFIQSPVGGVLPPETNVLPPCGRTINSSPPSGGSTCFEGGQSLYWC